MSRVAFAGALAGAFSVFGFVSTSHAANFVSQIPAGTYVPGDIGAAFTDPSVSLGEPGAIIGAGTGFDGIFSPFNGHYESTQMSGIGVGGSVTFGFDSPISLVDGGDFGVFTNTSLSDSSYPNGHSTSPAKTLDQDFYGARRSAKIEVATTLGEFHDLGRFVLDLPANYFANATAPYQFPAPASPVVADFGKPFDGELSDFDDADFASVLATLNGSAGGSWVDVPDNLGGSGVQFVRFSEPLWQMPDGSLEESVLSSFGTPTPAGVFFVALSANGVNIPEPTSLVGVGLTMFGMMRRRTKSSK
ncbi:MAG TPA: PEP-CTERM sorting domain-containing protein [Tepidisphaeraceae bacterium]|nr:PEP-CTERM sorting domain-containing protein [Tepidisphaeraceae bacterium]